MEEMKVVPVPWYRRKAWVLRNFGTPGFLIGAPITYVLGILTMLPTGWELGENATTVIASAVTSLAAVGGAIAVWHYQQDQESVAAGKYVMHVLESPLSAFDELEPALSNAVVAFDQQAWKALSVKLDAMSSAMTRVSAPHLTAKDHLLLKLDVRASEMIIEGMTQTQSAVNTPLGQLKTICEQISRDHMARPHIANLADDLRTGISNYKTFCRNLKVLI